jgi:hypothetical protein
VTRRLAGLVALLVALPLGGFRPAVATPADDCAQQHRRVRLPSGFAEASLSFTGVLRNGRNRVGNHFPSGDLRELRVIVSWTDAERSHHQRLELYSPDGSLYQRYATTFTGARRAVSVITRVPVAGSQIVDSGLYGEWCAEVFLDDEDAPIARHRFELTAP